MVTFSLGAKPENSYEEAKEQDKKMAAMLHNGGKHVVKPTYDERFRPDK